SETANRFGGGIQPLQAAVERQVEIVTGLLAVGDDIQPGRQLIVDCGDHCVRAKFLDIGFTELIEMGGSKLQPSRKGITPDHGSLQRAPRVYPSRHGIVFWRDGRLGFRVHWLTAQPPSTVMIWPVIGAESCRKRKQAGLATSSGLSIPLVSGCLCAMYSVICGLP